MTTGFDRDERDRLEQELLELHFDCHPDPAALQARLEREPRLRELQQEVLGTAVLLRNAARPETDALRLAALRGPRAPSRWRAIRTRGLIVAATAAAGVAVTAAWWGVDTWRERAARSEQCRVTVTAPQAVPAGSPWSFTVDAEDLAGGAQQCDLHWRAVLADGSESTGTNSVRGHAVVAMPPLLSVPKELQVRATRAGADEFAQTLQFATSAAPILVHATVDKPVYRPGETVRARATALDRCTQQGASLQLSARVLDARGTAVFEGSMEQAFGDDPLRGVGALSWPVPAGAGGPHTLEIYSRSGAIAPERVPFVVRAFAAPRLQKHVVLDRKTYPPGGRGSAEVRAERLGGGAADGAAVQATLVLDGAEVWQAQGALDQDGRAVFRFAVPEQVAAGAARFVARITDGGVVESQVKPFVVPTGVVVARAYPEGGELVAGVRNRVYVELQDPLDRPVDGAGVVVDERGERVADFVTAHQGRAAVEFTPRKGARYEMRSPGMTAPLALPAVQDQGIALLAPQDGIAAGAPLRVRVAGRGDGPWVVAAFCRGVLVGQAAARPDSDGGIDRDVEVTLPAATAGVLRVTVFDRAMQPVAERLVQRQAAQRVDVAMEVSRPQLRGRGPDSREWRVDVWARDERGEPIADAAVGLMVTDGSALAMGDEPRIGLLEQMLLFADVERLEDLGDFFTASSIAAASSARNVDLLLGTRGWRRFVWRNDDAAKAALAAAGDWGRHQLEREGFAQRPQAVDNAAEVAAAVVEPARAARRSGSAFAAVWRLGLGAAMGWLVLELLGCVRLFGMPRWMLPSLATASAAVVLAWQLPMYGAMPVDAMPAMAVAEFGDAMLRFEEFGGVDKGEWQRQKKAIGAEDLFLGAARKAGIAAPGAGGQQPAPVEVLDELEIAPVLEVGNQVRRERRPAGGPASPGPGGPGTPGPIRMHGYAHRHVPGAQRNDFTETVAWFPFLVTDAGGKASMVFDTSDAVTTWHVRADAHGHGRVGEGEATFATTLPLHAEARLPLEASAGDVLRVPIAVTCADGDADRAEIQLQVDGPALLIGPNRRELALARGRGRELVELHVTADGGAVRLRAVVQAAGFEDRVEQSFPVVPRGFPHRQSRGGTVAAGGGAELAVALPAESQPGSGHALLRVFPSPLGGMLQGLEGILREPHGCFEQASSSNYPNVMVLSWLEASGDDVPAVAARARELLPKGYGKITGYECKERGYEWFGGDPGHEALTAYGLQQFADMARVYDVDAGMVERTRQWLLGRRDGNGGYARNARALDSFGRAPETVTDAYVTLALLQSGVPAAELEREVDALAARATTDDAYELALIALALDAAGRDAAPARQRLATLQRDDGSLRGSTKSITSSGGNDLAVETTAWSVLAWLPAPAHTAEVQRAVAFLQSQQQAGGTFGATQATICALRALTAYAGCHRATKAAGTVRVLAGERVLASLPFAAGRIEPLEVDLWPLLPPGEHALRLELQSDGDAALPWACDVTYHSELPADAPDGAVGLAARLLQGKVVEGGTATIELLVQNRTVEGQPMALVRLGLPAGLELPTAVLDDRKKAGDFDLWELRGRELALYWRSLPPSFERRVRLDALATVPGGSTGAASSAALYYTPDGARWATPLTVVVDPAK